MLFTTKKGVSHETILIFLRNSMDIITKWDITNYIGNLFMFHIYFVLIIPFLFVYIIILQIVFVFWVRLLCSAPYLL